MNDINRNKLSYVVSELETSVSLCNRLQFVDFSDELLSLQQLHSDHFPSLFTYVNLFVKDVETVEELIEEQFLTIYEKRMFHLSEQELVIYLFKSCRKQVVNLLKPKNLHHIEFLIFGQPVISFFSSHLVFPAYDVLNQLNSLTFEQKEIAIFKFLIRKDITQIAQIIQKTPSSVVRNLDIITSKLDQFSSLDA